MPKISVIMPAYNAERFVEAAINSVLSQTYSDFELLVIDDCSKDNTYALISELAKKDNRITLYQNKKNLGVSFTRNLGVSKAHANWIAFLDSDDMWREDKLEKQIHLLQYHPEAVLSYTASSFIDFAGKPYSYVMRAVPKITYKMLLRRNLISCSSVVVRKDIIAQIKMGNDMMHEDYSAWLMILRDYGFAYGLDEPLLIYRLSKKSKSSNRFKSAKMLFNSYRCLGYGMIVSLFMILRYSIHSISKRYDIKKSRS